MPHPLDRCRMPRGRSRFKPDQRTPKSTLSDFENHGNPAQTAVTQATAETAGIGDVASAAARGFGREVKPSVHFIETGDHVWSVAWCLACGIRVARIRAGILARNSSSHKRG